MKVILEFNRVLAHHYPRKELSVEVRDNGVLGDLFQSVSRLEEPRLPESLWNYDEDRFRGPVLLTSGGRVIRDKNEKLFNGQRIVLRRCIVGG